MTARWSDPHCAYGPPGLLRPRVYPRLGLSHPTVKHHLANARFKAWAGDDGAARVDLTVRTPRLIATVIVQWTTGNCAVASLDCPSREHVTVAMAVP